jgi:hypothetical protein
MAGVRKLRLRLIAVSASIGLVASGCGDSSGSTVVESSGPPAVRVSTFPWPEGRLGPVAAVRSVPGVYVPLREIRSAMPKNLPENPKQECGAGATVVVVLENGRARTYGPCHRPVSIEHLRLALIRAAERRYPTRAPRRPVAGHEWKNLINDWYDGHIDGWYRCAVVLAASKHLPTSPPTFSTVRQDFRSYAKAVCPPA